MKPKNALTVWIQGDDLMVEFPGVGTAKTHTVSLPATAAGAGRLLAILFRRAAHLAASASHLDRIGHDSAPTQAQCDAWLRAHGGPTRSVHPPKGKEVEELLRNLGLLG